MASSRDRGRARHFLALCGLLSVCGLVACGGSTPTEAAIYHDPALRPGAIDAASDVERELLSRLSELPAGESVRVGSGTFVLEPAYAAASGRRCRAIASVELPEARRLACEAPDGWVFVPDVRQEPGGQEPGGAAQ